MRKPLLDGGGPASNADLGRGAAASAVRAELVDPLADGRWEAFVAASPGAGVFHHRAWLRLLHRSFGFPMTACCLVDGAGAIRAGAPLAFVTGGVRRARLVSVPLAHECALLPTADDTLAARLLHALDELRRSLRIPAELRGPIAGHRSAYVSSPGYSHRIVLDDDPGELVRRSARASQILKSVRSARRDGLTVARRTDAGALAELHRLRLGTQRRRGLPTEPRRFLLGLAHLFDRGLGSVLLLRDGARAVAGATLLSFNGTLVYGYPAADRFAPPCADDILIVAAMSRGCASGMHTLDLGRTPLGDAQLRELKRSWGGEERRLQHYLLADEPPRPRDQAGAAWAGPLIRGGPPAVSRLAGEVTCRWA